MPLDLATATASEMIDEIAHLRAVLRRLANEVAGLSAFEAGLRSEIGHTNYEVLMVREDEARDALSR